MPVLRLQLPCAGANRPDPLRPCAAARTGDRGRAVGPSAPDLGLFRRWHAQPDGPVDCCRPAGRRDANRSIRPRIWKSRWRRIRPASRPGGWPIIAPPGSTGYPSVSKASTRPHCAPWAASTRPRKQSPRSLWRGDCFPRVSFDLIYARPGQDLAGWRAELRAALAIAADHLSLYQLTIEPATAVRRAAPAGQDRAAGRGHRGGAV